MQRFIALPLVAAMMIALVGCAEPPKTASKDKSTDTDNKKAASADKDQAAAADAAPDNGGSEKDKAAANSNSDTAADDAAASADDTAVDENWGTLRGRFVFDGTPPEPKKLEVTKDIEVCTEHHPVDQSLLVGKDGGLQNVVVYTREEDLEVHPEYEGSKDEPAVIDNKFCAFVPRVATMQTGQTLKVKNSDATAHNSNFSMFNNDSENPIVPPNSHVDLSFQNSESYPMPVRCNIHPWMQSFVVVRDNPYFAVTGEDGTFEIKNLPVGEHNFQFWQEKRAGLAGIDIAGETTDKRGRATITIEPGVNDIGEITITADDLEK